MKKNELEKEIKTVAQKEKELDQIMNPKTKKDFKNLHKIMENKINKSRKELKCRKFVSQKEFVKQSMNILKREIKMLQEIDEKKIIANKENKKKMITNFFKNMSEAKKWKRSDGRNTLVTTPESMQATELYFLYKSLEKKSSDIEERLDVLLRVRFITRSKNTLLTQEINDLINREADILNRGRPESSLEGLRKRLSVLFLDFIENPNQFINQSKNNDSLINIIST